jgi:hypothetical protein
MVTGSISTVASTILKSMRLAAETIETDAAGVRWGIVYLDNVHRAGATPSQFAGYLSALDSLELYKKEFGEHKGVFGRVRMDPHPDVSENPEPEADAVTQALVAYLRSYALDHYDSKSVDWNVLVECWTDADIIREMGGARTERGARRAVRSTLSLLAERRREVESTAF